MSDTVELPSPPPGHQFSHRKCPSCGADLNELQTFCPDCGKSVETFFAPRPTSVFQGKGRGIAMVSAGVLVLAGICLLVFGVIVDRMRGSLGESLETPPPVASPEQDSEARSTEVADFLAEPMPDPAPLVAPEPEPEPEPKPVPKTAIMEVAQRRYEVGLALEKQAAALTADPDGALLMMQNAMREYRAAATKGHLDALTRLAEIYAKGILVPVDMKKAANYYLESAEGGVRRARDAVAAMYVDGLIGPEECPECMDWLQRGADRGSKDVEYALGKAYLQGELLPKDAEKALYYLRRSGQAGKVEAMSAIGYLLLSEESGMRDLPKAHSFFLRAASSGQPQGLNSFYTWLREQIVEDMDARQPMRGVGDLMVIRKYTGLVVRGEVQAVSADSVTVIQKGSPTELDFPDIDLNSRTALDPKFRELVAGLRLHENLAALAKGKVDPLQPAEGRADIQRANGLALKDGSYGVRDYPAAFVWLRTAAHQDDVAAMYYLGEMYYRGYGADRNQSLALAWMERAKSAGYGPAATFIERHWANQEKYAQMQKMARDALLVERDRHARDLERIGSEPDYNIFFSTTRGMVDPTRP